MSSTFASEGATRNFFADCWMGLARAFHRPSVLGAVKASAFGLAVLAVLAVLGLASLVLRAAPGGCARCSLRSQP